MGKPTRSNQHDDLLLLLLLLLLASLRFSAHPLVRSVHPHGKFQVKERYWRPLTGTRAGGEQLSRAGMMAPHHQQELASERAIAPCQITRGRKADSELSKRRTRRVTSGRLDSRMPICQKERASVWFGWAGNGAQGAIRTHPRRADYHRIASSVLRETREKRVHQACHRLQLSDFKLPRRPCSSSPRRPSQLSSAIKYTASS